ncbi:unnamed protein product [Nippostrongylus brasiliensis]|nr:unnamed protein product [Nippostrongylus brasiliensis]
MTVKSVDPKEFKTRAKPENAISVAVRLKNSSAKYRRRYGDIGGAQGMGDVNRYVKVRARLPPRSGRTPENPLG